MIVGIGLPAIRGFFSAVISIRTVITENVNVSRDAYSVSGPARLYGSFCISDTILNLERCISAFLNISNNTISIVSSVCRHLMELPRNFTVPMIDYLDIIHRMPLSFYGKIQKKNLLQRGLPDVYNAFLIWFKNVLQVFTFPIDDKLKNKKESSFTAFTHRRSISMKMIQLFGGHVSTIKNLMSCGRKRRSGVKYNLAIYNYPETSAIKRLNKYL